MTAAVMRDTAVAVVGKKQQLVFEGVGAERPSVAEHHRLSFAPVFVIDRRAVFGRDHRHRIHFLSVCVPLPSAYFFINDDPGVTDWSRSSNSYQPETTSFLLMIQVVL